MKEVLSQTLNALSNDPEQKDNTKTLLTRNDLSNKDKVKAELDRLKKLPASTTGTIINEVGANENYNLFKTRLEKIVNFQYPKADKSQFDYIMNTDLYNSTGGKDRTLQFDDTSEEQDLKRQLSAVKALIRETKKNISVLDAYWMRLLSGKGFTKLSSDQKFVKTAEVFEKEADEVIEDYYDDLYEDSPRSPNYGKILNHPEKYHHTLTTEASNEPKKPKFKKL